MTISIEQFNKLVTKDEFNERLDNLESRLATKEDINMILIAIDGLAKKIEIQDSLVIPAKAGIHGNLKQN